MAGWPAGKGGATAARTGSCAGEDQRLTRPGSVTGRGSGSGASGAGASGAADGGVAGVQEGSRATSAGAPAGRSARGAALAGTHHAARGHSAGLAASALRHLQPSGAKEREGGRGGGASGRGSAGRTANSAGTGRVSRPSSRPATPTGTTQWASSREVFVRLHSSSGTRGTEEHAGSRGSSRDGPAPGLAQQHVAPLRGGQDRGHRRGDRRERPGDPALWVGGAAGVHHWPRDWRGRLLQGAPGGAPLHQGEGSHQTDRQGAVGRTGRPPPGGARDPRAEAAFSPERHTRL